MISQSKKKQGGKVFRHIGGHNLFPLVEIGLTDLSKYGLKVNIPSEIKPPLHNQRLQQVDQVPETEVVSAEVLAKWVSLKVQPGPNPIF